jgi:CRISPR-associated Csx10 family RAMP protein
MPKLEIRLHGHLLVSGNQALDLGVDLATVRRFHKGEEIPYIPATAIRGAVRIQLEALLAGIGETDVGPYVLDERPGTIAESYHGIVARLFGFSDRTGERSGSKEGCLRFSDGLPRDPARACQALAVRPGLELEDQTAAAADQKLFFRQVVEAADEPLVFEASLGLGSTAQEDIAKLRAAVESTDALGAGRAKGGGFIEIHWIDDPPAECETDVTETPEIAQRVTRAQLILTLEEPAHFGDGGPRGNHHATRTYIPGATVRGAIAWALLRNGISPDDSDFRRLFVDDPASFADALLAADPEVEPLVVPVTAQEQRGTHTLRDILPTELARERINRALEGSGRYLRLDDGLVRFDPVERRPARNLLRRTRTRVSIDRHTGAAADNRLFSIEQVEPWLARTDESEPTRPARFSGWVEGLAPEATKLLVRAASLPILLGGGRNHGLGRARLEVRLADDPALDEPEKTVLSLAELVDREAASLAKRAGITLESADGPVPLALVARSDYAPGERDRPHPLAERDLAETGGDLPLARSFFHSAAVGGYDQLRREGSLKDLVPAVGAGSVFVYTIDREELGNWLGAMLPRLRRGVGRWTESGCGRFGLFEPLAKE